jgi:hypothetical protein
MIMPLIYREFLAKEDVYLKQIVNTEKILKELISSLKAFITEEKDHLEILSIAMWLNTDPWSYNRYNRHLKKLKEYEDHYEIIKGMIYGPEIEKETKK